MVKAVLKKNKMKKFTLIFFALTCLIAQSRAQNKPNIVFILADDLGYGDVGCYGQQKIQTPNIDALAAGGMKFTNFYAGSTVCAPSRASLMTGLHTGHTYVRGNGEVPLRVQDTALPQLLKQQGYTTGMVGKWGLGLKDNDGIPEKKGWDFFAGHLHHVEGHAQKPDSAWHLINGVTTRVKIPDDLYANEWFTNNAIDFIQQNKTHPFFLYVAFTLPHAELKVPSRYMAKYLTNNGQSVFAPEVPWAYGQHYDGQPYPKAAYAAMVTEMDDHIGMIMQKLRALKLDKNTIVIFTSDNGTHIEGGRTVKDIGYFNSTGNMRGHKRDLYDGGVHTPFIAYWQGHIAAHTTSSYVGAFWDVMPTLLNLAGMHYDKGDGISFLPTLQGKPQLRQHDFLYWEFYEEGFKQAVLKGTWKAVRFYNGTKPDRVELYDLSSDIGEQKNVATEHPQIVQALVAIMDREHVTAESPLFQIK